MSTVAAPEDNSTDASAAAAREAIVEGATAGASVPQLIKLAVGALGRGLTEASSRPPLEGLPSELSKLVWKEVRAALKRQEHTPTCADMFPFVSACWRVETLDLSDAAKWVTNASLGAVGSVTSLRSVRLTGCRFVGDDGMTFASRLPQLATLDVSWTDVGDIGAASLGRCVSLTSLNLTGLVRLSDAGVSSLLSLTAMERLGLACTPITDVALDYLTYYTRHPDAGPPTVGLHGLRWLELSSTKITDTGLGKLVAIIENGTPYGRVFQHLEYLALSSTGAVGPTAVRQVRTRYGFDAPLPNAQRTLAKSNSIALEAQPWVLRLSPTDRSLPTPSRTWEDDRVVAYVAQYTKEMAASVEVIRMLEAADHAPPPPPAEGPSAKRSRLDAATL
mmetsp:Transcript_27854/g.71112  ORF Transcript_27854/g.71112 Transcript_27854/m.71112 type:complete len:391 (+) Transcript_27854:255-1427(+)